MRRKKKKGHSIRHPTHTARGLRKPPRRRWREKLPTPSEAERYAAKEAQKQREIVDVVLRLVITNPKDEDVGFAMEIETTMERGKLVELQEANDQARVWINYIKEQK